MGGLSIGQLLRGRFLDEYSRGSNSGDLTRNQIFGSGDSKSLGFVGRADEKLMEFLKLESAIRKIALTLYLGRWQSRARVKSVRRLHLRHSRPLSAGSTVNGGLFIQTTRNT